MMKAIAESGAGMTGAKPIHKMGRHAVDSNMLFIQDLWIAEEDRIGAEGEGFKIILHGLNPERVLIGAEAVGIGRAAIGRAARYARERIVFNRPIGMNTPHMMLNFLAEKVLELPKPY